MVDASSRPCGILLHLLSDQIKKGAGTRNDFPIGQIVRHCRSKRIVNENHHKRNCN